MPSTVPVIAFISTAMIVLGAGSYFFGMRGGQADGRVADAQPLFARSVEQGSVASDRWSQRRLEVPYYGPMVELLTFGASLSRPQQHERVHQPPPGQSTAKSTREQRRDSARNRRAKSKPPPDDESTTGDPRDAYARGEPQGRGWRANAEDEGGRSPDFNRGRDERETRRPWNERRRVDESRREPEERSRAGRERWQSERQKPRDGFNLFGGFGGR